MTPESIEAARKLYESRNPVPESVELIAGVYRPPLHSVNQIYRSANDYNYLWQGFLDCYQIKSVIELEELRKAVVPEPSLRATHHNDSATRNYWTGANDNIYRINAAFDRQILERGTS